MDEVHDLQLHLGESQKKLKQANESHKADEVKQQQRINKYKKTIEKKEQEH